MIVEREAQTVLRIFEEYARGDSARDIARRLNAERVVPPRGRFWNGSTINGLAERGSGILRNELYVGRLIWNRVRMVKDPEAGRRVSRPNPEQDWQVVEVPELAIVPVELFEAARTKIKARSDIPVPKLRRDRRLLSGLLRCGACGSGMSVYGGSRREKRVCCTRHHESGSCPAPHTFRLDTIENAVLTALRSELQHPMVIAEFVRTYHEERRRLSSQQGAKRASSEKRLQEVRREIDRIIDGIARGELSTAVFGPKATVLDEERKGLEASLADQPEKPIALHPAALARYEEMVGKLQQSIAAGMASGNSEYSEAIRDLVESVTVRPGKGPGQVEVEIVGRLNNLLGQDAYLNGQKAVSGRAVAGARLSQTRHSVLCGLRACG